ncbi:MAG TPA: PQQ-binding-like beta-propeller repeat protein [Myxococcaceae bacterium]|nr:PQQ-binding-like beta-propeller repeat protein [Myxococcaceae bacterium]
MPPPAPADPPEPDCRPRRAARPRLPSWWPLVAALSTACSAPLVPVFTTSGDAPSRTGLTALGEGAVFGNDAGRVIRLDGAGRVLWAVETGAEVEFPVVVSEDGVVGAVTGGDTLVALDAESGHERWRASGQPPVAAIAAAGTRILLLGKEGELRSFPARAGGMPLRRGWNASLGLRGRSPPRGLLALERGVLAIGPTAVLLLSPEDGALRWKAPAQEPIGAVLEADALWVAEQSGRLLVLDARSGAQRRVMSAGQRVVSPPSAALGRIWVGTEDRSLVGVDAHGAQTPFRASLPAALMGGVAEWQDRVLVPTAGREGRLLAIDLARPGSPATARVDSALRSRPLVRGGVAWVLAADGRVLGFRLR